MTPISLELKDGTIGDITVLGCREKCTKETTGVVAGARSCPGNFGIEEAEAVLELVAPLICSRIFGSQGEELHWVLGVQGAAADGDLQT